MPELNFPGYDIIVPICLPDAKNPKSRPMMTFIAVQVKNRKGDKLTAGLRNEACFSFDTTAEQWETNNKLNIPYIFIMMSLRCQQEAVEILPSNKSERYSRGESRESDSIVVLATGMSLDLYPGVELEETMEQSVESLDLLGAQEDVSEPGSFQHYAESRMDKDRPSRNKLWTFSSTLSVIHQASVFPSQLTGATLTKNMPSSTMTISSLSTRSTPIRRRASFSAVDYGLGVYHCNVSR
jgi:hypothetical protein